MNSEETRHNKVPPDDLSLGLVRTPLEVEPTTADPDREFTIRSADELDKLIKRGFSGAWGEREEAKESTDRGGISKSRRKTLRRNKAAKASRRQNRKKGKGKK